MRLFTWRELQKRKQNRAKIYNAIKWIVAFVLIAIIWLSYADSVAKEYEKKYVDCNANYYELGQQVDFGGETAYCGTLFK